MTWGKMPLVRARTSFRCALLHPVALCRFPSTAILPPVLAPRGDWERKRNAVASHGRGDSPLRGNDEGECGNDRRECTNDVGRCTNDVGRCTSDGRECGNVSRMGLSPWDMVLCSGHSSRVVRKFCSVKFGSVGSMGLRGEEYWQLSCPGCAIIFQGGVPCFLEGWERARTIY